MNVITRSRQKKNSASLLHIRADGSSRHRLVLILLFLICLITPLDMSIGTLALSPYRLFLIIALIPCFLMLVSDRKESGRASDIFMILHAFWASIALSIVHGGDRTEFAGMYVIETLGAYFLGRWLIRTPADFRVLVKTTLILIVFMLPFTIIEALTGNNIILDFLGQPRPATDIRLGMHRALGPFQHPILYGVFCASGLGLIFYVLRRGRQSILHAFQASLPAIATFVSASSGPLLTLVVQILLIAWDKTTSYLNLRRRWWILACLTILFYVFIDIASNRTPFHVFVDYLTFNSASSYNRILIYEYGSAEVIRHPIFGIGLNDWVRPAWMHSGSVDAFWLLQAMRYGLPALIFLISAFLTLCVSVGRAKLDVVTQNYRKGWLITILGMALAGSSVHFWGPVYVWFMFLLGSGAWMTSQKGTTAQHGESNVSMNPPRRVGAYKNQH